MESIDDAFAMLEKLEEAWRPREEEAWRLAQLRAQEERRSALYHQKALEEIAEKLGSHMHSDYGYVPGRRPASPPPTALPSHITDPNSILGHDFQGLSRAELKPPTSPGRRSYVELVKVGPVRLHPVPYTENLEFTRVYGLPVVTGKGEFKEGDLAVWLPLGTGLPPTKPLEFIHQNKNYEVRARRFRGVESCGVLLPLTQILRIADSLTGKKGITASADCWNVWLAHLLGSDMSAGLGLRNPV